MKAKIFLPLIATLFLLGCNNNSLDNNNNSEVNNNDTIDKETTPDSQITSAELINNWNISGGTDFKTQDNIDKALTIFNSSFEGLVISFESENMFSNPNDADESSEKPSYLTLGSGKASGSLMLYFSKTIKKATVIASGYTKYTYPSSETTNLTVDLGDTSKKDIVSPNDDLTFVVDSVNGSSSLLFKTSFDNDVSGYRAFLKSIVVEW